MNRFNSFILIVLVTSSYLHGWKGTETTGERPTFFGTLTSQEGNVFNVTNVTVGRSPSSHDKVILYEMPKSLKESENGSVLPVNPDEDLTTAHLELLRIKAIEVPRPHVTWKWKDPESTRPTAIAREFIEVIVTWTSGSKVHYLLELGPEDTKRPVKVYCDVVDKPLQGERQDGTLFCPGLNKIDLHKKGAPFQSIKILKLEEPCFKIPTTHSDNSKKN